MRLFRFLSRELVTNYPLIVIHTHLKHLLRS